MCTHTHKATHHTQRNSHTTHTHTQRDSHTHKCSLTHTNIVTHASHPVTHYRESDHAVPNFKPHALSPALLQSTKYPKSFALQTNPSHLSKEKEMCRWWYRVAKQTLFVELRMGKHPDPCHLKRQRKFSKPSKVIHNKVSMTNRLTLCRAN